MQVNLRQTKRIKSNGHKPNVLEEIIIDEIETVNEIFRELEEQVFINIGKNVVLHIQRFYYEWSPKKQCYILGIRFEMGPAKDRYITDSSKDALIYVATYGQALRDALSIIYGK